MAMMTAIFAMSVNAEDVVSSADHTKSEPVVSTEDANKTPDVDGEVVSSSIYHGQIQVDQTFQEMFTGQTDEVEKGTKIEMTVSTVVGSNVSMEGDEFFAELTEDISTDSGIVLPMGTVAHGKVVESEEQKRLGRDGYVIMDFDYLITPDGREIPIKARMSTKSHPLASFAKVVLTDAGYTLAGGAMGGLMALKIGGVGLAVASNGYSIAGGAGVGATAGAVKSLARKGKPRVISPGDKIEVKLSKDIELPVFKLNALEEEEVSYNGLEADITDYKLEKDPFGSLNTITLNIEVINRSQKTFTFFDMALVSEYGSVYYPSPFGDTDMWFQKLKPGTKFAGYMSFCVDNPRENHWLVFYDKYSRKELAKISVRNAMRRLQADGNGKKPKRS